jgi:hypothetical protein
MPGAGDTADDDVLASCINNDGRAIGWQIKIRQAGSIDFACQHVAYPGAIGIPASCRPERDRHTGTRSGNGLIGALAAQAVGMAQVAFRVSPASGRRSRRKVVSIQTLPTTCTRIAQDFAVAQASICSNRVL